MMADERAPATGGNGPRPEKAPPDARARRAEQEFDQAASWLGADAAQRRLITRALIAAVVLHATVLVARMPDWGRDPVRVDAPAEQQMKVQFLKPPPPPPKTPPRPPEPVKKKVPRPDPTPDEPEPIREPPPPPPAPEVTAPPTAAPAQDMGPIRVSPGQGPGLIRKVEPQYPPIARASRTEGSVVVDAVIRSDGTVSDVKVVKSSSPMFEQACLDAVKQWRFTPGPQDVILTVTVKFTLQ
ncbi:MAG TPA: TonB family protein [Vicinamibacterales bacterium]|nr:TonB family protein [Vicinamibacterales bacterium]